MPLLEALLKQIESIPTEDKDTFFQRIQDKAKQNQKPLRGTQPKDTEAMGKEGDLKEKSPREIESGTKEESSKEIEELEKLNNQILSQIGLELRKNEELLRNKKFRESK